MGPPSTGAPADIDAPHGYTCHHWTSSSTLPYAAFVQFLLSLRVLAFLVQSLFNTPHQCRPQRVRKACIAILAAFGLSDRAFPFMVVFALPIEPDAKLPDDLEDRVRLDGDVTPVLFSNVLADLRLLSDLLEPLDFVVTLGNPCTTEG